MKKQNCWEFSKCGRESRSKDRFFSEDGTCPASTELCLDGVNDGKTAGRACWVVAGTMCCGETQGDVASKLKSCVQCMFYQKVKVEEGDKFVTGSELMEIVMFGADIVAARLSHPKEKSRPKYNLSRLSRFVETQVSTEAVEPDTIDIASVVSTIFNVITTSLTAGDSVNIRGFGSFQVKRREPRGARNPKTGKSIFVEAKRQIIFRPGSSLSGKYSK